MFRALRPVFFIAAALGFIPSSVFVVASKHVRLRRKLQQRQTLDFPCLLGRVGIEEDEEPTFPYWFCELDPRDANGMMGIILPVQGLELTPEQEALVVDGSTTLFADGYYVEQGENIIVIPPGSDPVLDFVGVPPPSPPSPSPPPPPPGPSPVSFSEASASSSDETLSAANEENNEAPKSQFLFPEPPTSFGNKKVLAIRVKASDIQSSHSPRTMSREIFGIGGFDPFNMVTQFDACSYGQFTISPFEGFINGKTISEGVYETTIPVRASGMNKFSLQNAVTNQLNQELGASWYIRAGIDFVMYCLPTRDFTAYAYFNRYLSVYSDGWCLFPSGHMHELGHNLNLHHSNENGFEYRDQTGLMGFSYLSDDFPRMCFNGPKSWQLGWYEDAHRTFSGRGTWNGEFVGVSDYEESRGKTVVLKIETDGFNDDHYVAFNRADGINSGTQEAPDRVLVTSQFRNPPARSCLDAKLDDGGEYGVTGYFDSRTVLVQVNDIIFSDPAIARVTVKVNEPPVARCDSVTLKVDSSGSEVCIRGSELGKRSTDDSFLSLEFSPTRLCFNSVGTHRYNLRVTDAYSLSDVCSGKVTVVGSTPQFSMSYDYSLSMDFSMSMRLEDIDEWDLEFGRTDPKVN